MSVTPTLTPREHAFVAAYLETHNATQAYIKAGYSPKGANANAARLIAKDSVSAAIQSGEASAQKRNIKTVDDVVERLSRIAFTGMSRFTMINADGDIKMDTSNCTPADLVNGGDKTGHGAAQNQASGGVPSAMARTLAA